MGSEKKKETKGKRRILLFLLIAVILFALWLLVLLLLSMKSWEPLGKPESGHGNMPAAGFMSPAGKESHQVDARPGHEVEADMAKSSDGDEHVPAMPDLLEDLPFDKERFDALFEKMKSPSVHFPDANAKHSTSLKEVVYIYHSHNRESFIPYFQNQVSPEKAYHATANITVVGRMLGLALEKRGVRAQVDATDIAKELEARGLDFTASYEMSRELVLDAKKRNEDLAVFLDIHRDSLRKGSTTTRINGQEYARVLFVVGTGHENYEENVSFAEKLDTLLSSEYPGLSKGIILKDSTQGNGVYNQDISPESVIVEIGGVDNTLEELDRTAKALADVISGSY